MKKSTKYLVTAFVFFIVASIIVFAVNNKIDNKRKEEKAFKEEKELQKKLAEEFRLLDRKSYGSSIEWDDGFMCHAEMNTGKDRVFLCEGDMLLDIGEDLSAGAEVCVVVNEEGGFAYKNFKVAGYKKIAGEDYGKVAIVPYVDVKYTCRIGIVGACPNNKGAIKKHEGLPPFLNESFVRKINNHRGWEDQGVEVKYLAEYYEMGESFFVSLMLSFYSDELVEVSMPGSSRREIKKPISHYSYSIIVESDGTFSVIHSDTSPLFDETANSVIFEIGGWASPLEYLGDIDNNGYPEFAEHSPKLESYGLDIMEFKDGSLHSLTSMGCGV